MCTPLTSCRSAAAGYARTFARMAIPAASPGASCSVSPVTAMSMRRTARSCMASTRLPMSLRQRVAARGRRAPCKSAKGLGQPLALLQVSHHCVLPHARLRQALATPVATHGRGSAKVWRLRTPALAAGRTAHGWSRRAVLMCRVPPGPQPQTVFAPVLMGVRGGARLRYVQMEAKWAG
jgi:hypothetical protein